MTTRIVRTPELMRNGARVVGDALGSSMQRLGSPTHLSYMAGKPPAAGTPPPGSFFASIPPSSRVAMRRRAGGATPFIYRDVEGAKDFFKQDELQPIGLHGRRVDKGAARAASRTRQRDEQNNVSNAPALKGRDVHKQLIRAAATADRKVYRRFKTLDRLLSTLANEAFSELKAKTRVSVLETAAEESDIALQQALYDVKMVLAENADVVARGGTVSYEMEDAELEAHQRTAQAARGARASRKMVQDALRVVKECHEQVEISSKIARKCEAAYLAAQRVATHLRDNADRVGETLRAVPEGRGVAPLRVATLVGMVEGGGVSSCDGEQEEPPAKRARR